MALPFFRRRGPTTPRAPRPPIAKARVRLAWAIALSADLLQLALVPLFGPGFASPFDNALDVFVAIALTALLGWHWEFLPGFLTELVPFVDLVPTWSLACWLATRGRAVVDAGPPPPAGSAPSALNPGGRS